MNDHTRCRCSLGAPEPDPIRVGDVVMIPRILLEGSIARVDDVWASVGYDPSEVLVVAGDRLTVRSLLTREHRVILERELD